VVPEDYAWQLYVCDESGMPALRRRLESIAKLPVRPEIHAVVTVGDESYKDYLAHLSDVQHHLGGGPQRAGGG
jgi:ferric-chelate reductase (NADPH)